MVTLTKLAKDNSKLTPEKMPRDLKGKAKVFKSHHFSKASC